MGDLLDELMAWSHVYSQGYELVDEPADAGGGSAASKAEYARS